MEPTPILQTSHPRWSRLVRRIHELQRAPALRLGLGTWLKKVRIRVRRRMVALFSLLPARLARTLLVILRRLEWLVLHSPGSVPVYEKAPRVEAYPGYFQAEGLAYRLIELGFDYRPAVATMSGESLRALAEVREPSHVRLGLGILGSLDPSLLDGRCRVSVSVQHGEQSVQSSFAFPVHGENRIWAHYLGDGWFDWYIELPSDVRGPVLLTAQATFEGEDGQPCPGEASTPAVAWSAPQVLARKRSREARRVILISGESLTDPYYLSTVHGLKLDIPYYDQLAAESDVHLRAWSQGDSTLPVSSGIMAGLLPSQHNVCDYGTRPHQYDCSILAPGVKTLADLLKVEGFLTIGAATQLRFAPQYGIARGFDTYAHVAERDHPLVPGAQYLIEALDAARHDDVFAFLHLDRLHNPYVLSTPPHRLVFRDGAGLNHGGTPEGEADLYAQRLHQFDLDLGQIITYLKSKGQWEETLLMVTGDHGWNVAWKHHSDFALYEARTRVPFVVKWPASLGRPPRRVMDATNASISGMRCVLDAYKIEPPAYLAALPQNDLARRGIAISETVMQPRRKPDGYAVALMGQQFKYFRVQDVDWVNLEVKQFIRHALFAADSAGYSYDEERDVGGEHPEILEEMSRLAVASLQAGFDFQRSHPRGDYRRDNRF